MVLPPLSPLCCSSSPPYFMASIRSAFFQSIDHGCNSDNQSLHHQLAGLFKTKTRQEVKYEGQHESTDCRAKDPASSAAKGDATQDDCSNRVQNHVLPNAGIGASCADKACQQQTSYRSGKTGEDMGEEYYSKMGYTREGRCVGI